MRILHDGPCTYCFLKTTTLDLWLIRKNYRFPNILQVVLASSLDQIRGIHDVFKYSSRSFYVWIGSRAIAGLGGDGNG
jgi:hypothetical protein